MRLLPSATYHADPDCRRMMIEPAASNTPMRKALDRIGWTFLGEFDIRPDRRIALYRTDRA
ncbi:lysine N-acyltransferase mbtK [Mycobacteroides abscessus subsp. abscessus]|nr:lysine N-acyltransferase mbtK [Mycobacteroides abscessus subsp. abscessus]